MYIGSINRNLYSRICETRRRSKRRIFTVIIVGVLMFSLGSLTTTAGYIFQNTIFNSSTEAEWVSLEKLQNEAQNEVPNEVQNGQSNELPNEMQAEQAIDPLPQTAIPEMDTNLVIIDPGHGGEDEGCERDGILEKDINLSIAFALQEKLLGMGYEVILTRDSDAYVSLEERIEIANTSGADMLVSIHQNAYEGQVACGIETWYASDKSGKDSGRLAKLLHNYLIKATGAEDRGVVESDELKIIRETNMPACLVETGFLSNAQERTLLTDVEYQAEIVEGLANGIQLFFYPKTMYLTFDDGPSAENTVAILDILKEKNIKATFFVIGENVRKNPEVAKRIVEEGHTIGIHCDNHDYDKLYASVDSYLADFEAAYHTVYEVTGVEVKLFRFPGGSINAYNKDVYAEIIAEMTARGFVYYDWNASLEDAVRNAEPEQLLQNARESTLGRKRIVMLAHDIVYSTTLCLEELIEQFPEYEMLPLTDDVEPIQFK